MYMGVPTAVRAFPSLPFTMRFSATPKSAIFTKRDSFVRRMFWSLMSRCTTPRPWRNRKALPRCSSHVMICCSGNAAGALAWNASLASALVGELPVAAPYPSPHVSLPKASSLPPSTGEYVGAPPPPPPAWASSLAAVRAPGAPLGYTRSCREPPSTYSMTTTMPSRVSITSSSPTIDGWCGRSRITRTSRISASRFAAPAPVRVAPTSAKAISFAANLRLSRRRRTRRTMPAAPRPSSRTVL
mmetsp:Transcript_28648/g.88770  ORF Transcript_28648/g.88770 Transcript_28648/m.88770 type:complete len:243 (+) Transcript_28648:136-864(+)